MRFSIQHQDPAARAIANELVERISVQREELLRDWFRGHDAYSDEWRDAAFVSDRVVYMTPTEVAALNAKIDALMDEFTPRLADVESRPEGAKPVKLVAWAHPL